MHVETGRSPGIASFVKATGIPNHRILGHHWPRWSDALKEAGLSLNELTQRRDSEGLLKGLVAYMRELNAYPTQSDLKFGKKNGRDLVTPEVYSAHFGGAAGIRKALRQFCSNDPALCDLLELIPDDEVSHTMASPTNYGHVYLLQSGQHFKVGRTDNLERLIREISVAMPTNIVLLHSIATDDPPGIEAYWHRRFAARRANGEWFALCRDDVAAFRRRKFQ